MKYITVLDFEVGRVFQYKVKELDFSDYEQIITDNGHRLNNCEWMVHEDGDIINKTGDLPF
jgi:hypothetical protein